MPKSIGRLATHGKHANATRSRSIQLNAGRREVSIRRLRRARAVLAACGVLPDGNRVLVHLAPACSAWVKRSRARPVWGLFRAVVPAPLHPVGDTAGGTRNASSVFSPVQIKG